MLLVERRSRPQMHQTDDREQPCLESHSSEKATASARTCQSPTGRALQEVSATGALARHELISLRAQPTLGFFGGRGECFFHPAQSAFLPRCCHLSSVRHLCGRPFSAWQPLIFQPKCKRMVQKLVVKLRVCGRSRQP